MNLLRNKVAFITGGASGIGRSTALCFAEAGARIAIVDVSEQNTSGEQVVQQISDCGGECLFIPCDVSKPNEMKRAVDKTIRKFGGLHLVFANAGINGVWAPIEELQPDEWDQTMAINLRGTFLTLHYAIPHLKASGGGSIIINSSVNGNRTFSNAGASAYSTSKAGQIALMKMAALELARFNIRVNAILPGAIHTSIGQSTKKRHTAKIAIQVKLPYGIPGIGHGEGTAAEVADVCLFLASDLSRHVSGAEIYVDGGTSLLM